MTLDDIYTRLGAIEEGAEMVTAIKAEITKLRNESKSNRIEKDEILKALNLNKGEEEKAKEYGDLVKALKAANVAPDSVLAKLASTEKAIADLTAKYDAAEKAAAEAKAKQIKMEQTSALVNALTAEKAASPSELSKLLLSNVTTKEDGTMAFILEGGEETTLENGVKGYLSANPWAVANRGTNGSGTFGPTGGEKRHYTPQEITTMSIDEINSNWDKGISDSLKNSN